MPTRFPMNADTYAEARDYILNRAVQLLGDGYKLISITPQEEWGVKARWHHESGNYQSIYVLASHRNKGHLKRYCQPAEQDFLTTPDCNLETYFQMHQISYRVGAEIQRYQEYQAVAKFYGYQRARRSQVPLMNHIDEGLAILNWIGASQNAKLAYCLHPLFQEDECLAASYQRLPEITTQPQVLALALEYRNVANGYLSHKPLPDEIYLGPLTEVHQMLVADKVQNYKDFLQYHADTHPRRKALDAYFQAWLSRLQISPDMFQEWRRSLIVELRA
jgi:hypothetical protein